MWQPQQPLMDFNLAAWTWIGVPLVLLGLATALGAWGWFAIAEFRRAGSHVAVDPPERPPALVSGWRWCLVLAIVIGTLVRVVGLGERSLSHPESYIPGIDLPAGISEPPPRHEFVETAVWHFRSEPHPFGYYLAMWAWTKTFGATLTAIRVPEMILGVLSIWLIYLVGTLENGPKVGVVAAALLSLHGSHSYWSQIARMWVPGTFLGLLSTWLLWKMTYDSRPHPGLGLAYVATTVAGAMTVEFYLVLLCGQMLWTAVNHSDTTNRIPRPAVYQALAFMLAAPMLSHGVMLGRNEAAPPPSAAFLREYFSFGFLFQHGAFAEHKDRYYELPSAASMGVFILSLVTIAAGFRAAKSRPRPNAVPSPSLRPLFLCAAGMAMVMLGIAVVSYVRHGALAALSVLPILALAIPFAAGAVRPAFARFAPAVERLFNRWPACTALMPSLAVAPALAIFAISFKLTLTAPRAFLIFVPYQLILIAVGVVALSRTRVAAAGIAAVLVSVFAASTAILHRTPFTTRDYQELGRQIEARSEPEDLVFTPTKHWAYTPLFFYVNHQRLVADHYADALRRAPHARVWLPQFLRMPQSDDARAALAGYRVVDQVYAPEAEAALYVRAP